MLEHTHTHKHTCRHALAQINAHAHTHAHQTHLLVGKLANSDLGDGLGPNFKAPSGVGGISPTCSAASLPERAGVIGARFGVLRGLCVSCSQDEQSGERMKPSAHIRSKYIRQTRHHQYSARCNVMHICGMTDISHYLI